jgi:repressor LexA
MVKPMKLTKRQKEILDFLTEFIEREGYSPSMEEVAEHFHFASLNAVFKHLEALEARGYLHRDANRARSIELSGGKNSGVRSLPLFGYIAAGQPIEAVANPESLHLPEELLPKQSQCYVLRVRGDSMIEEHIEDGDYVIVEACEKADNGDVVVALIDGESVTLKKLFSEGGKIRLQPANANIAPIILAPERVKIQGTVVAIMRKYR